MDPIIAQLSTSAVIVQLIEWMKESKWFPWFGHANAWANRAVALFFAFIAGIGLGWMYDPTSGILTVTGLQPSHIFNTLWSTFASYGTQYLIYKAVIRKGDPGQLPAAVAVAKPGVPTPVEIK